MERSTDKARLAKYKELELPLDDEQSDELCNVMKMIEETCPDQLRQEGDDHAFGDLVRDSWEVDKLNAKGNCLKINAKMASSALACFIVYG